jgi:FkbH-like protein
MLADRSDLDYFALLEEARQEARRRLTPQDLGEVRLALIADFTTAQLVPLLKVLFGRAGMRAAVYEAGFDSGETEALDPSSGLHAFAPDLVFVATATPALLGRFYGFTGPREEFAAATLDRLEGVWDALQRIRPLPILQMNVVAPLERPFGSYGHKVAASLTSACLTINQGLSARARQRASLYLVDVEALASYWGRRVWLDERLWEMAKTPFALAALPHVAQGVVDVALAILGREAKCLVLDLDNTLWDGIVAEDGIEGVEIGELADGSSRALFQHYVKSLKERGILLAVCSKNDEADALRVFREHPEMVLRESDVSVFVANWDDKARNVRRIQERLHIGFDSMVFVDDTPFERALVREMVPGVTVPEMPEDPADWVRFLSELNLFETASHSSLDGVRAELVADESRRANAQARFETIEGYLRSLGMQAGFRRFDEFSLPRIAQLIRRSNQFNLATRRFGEAECRSFMNDPAGYLPVYVTLRDRFGDMGLIAVLVLRVEGDSLAIDEYVMSCRVLKRGVEDFTLNCVVAAARELGLAFVRGGYRPSAKNEMVRDLYPRLGFTAEGESGDEARFVLDVASYQPRPVFIEPA